MFTGLIEANCQVKAVRQNSDGVTIVIDLGDIAANTNVGDSIAVNGVCLTVTELNSRQASFDCHPETLEKSTLSKLRPASFVNIERSMLPTDRFSGHFVQGHVDGTAKVQAIRHKGNFKEIDFSTSPQLLEQMVEKGSVAVDGISLTIAKLSPSGFTVAVIPQTWGKTTLNLAKVGDAVNIETDVIVKAVKTHLKKMLQQGGSLTEDKLKEMGF